jgi:hypothetical protein
MLPAPFLPSPPLPNDHFIHAKVLRQLSQDRMQEVVRSVVAKKFANLKSLKDFMSRQQHQSRERERVITQTARRLVVCLFVCHI